jgi:F-type H+-transporting ATPase subunit delta
VRESTVARSYAAALFELASRTKEHTAFLDAFETLSALLGADTRVRVFLATPKIGVAAKKSALRKALHGRVPKRFLNFVMVALDKRRQRLLSQMADEYRSLLDEHLGVLNVRITVAHEPDERAEEEITAELSRILGKKVLPHIYVDPAILGGIVVRYGDRLLDASLRRRLHDLRGRLLEATLPAPAETY